MEGRLVTGIRADPWVDQDESVISAIVSVWRALDGWHGLDCDEAPGRCCVHVCFIEHRLASRMWVPSVANWNPR